MLAFSWVVLGRDCWRQESLMWLCIVEENYASLVKYVKYESPISRIPYTTHVVLSTPVRAIRLTFKGNRAFFPSLVIELMVIIITMIIGGIMFLYN